MSVCAQEMCGNWTGDGCACLVFGVLTDAWKCPDCGCQNSAHEWCCYLCGAVPDESPAIPEGQEQQ